MSYAHFFLQPTNPTHRQYEALRAYFVEEVSVKEVARRFGYTEGSFRVLAHQFRRSPEREFFVHPAKGPKKAPKKDLVRMRVVELRKHNCSIYDIADVLNRDGERLSPVSISKMLKEEGFARLPRRRDEERPQRPRVEKAPTADVRDLDLSARSFRTKFGGLFLFMPLLVELSFDEVLRPLGLPGSGMIPASLAIRSLLALKLFGSARHSHAMSYVLDEGLALFAGLNETPKRSFLTEYSSRIDPAVYPQWMRLWNAAVGHTGLPRGESFDLDYHTIPFHGEDAILQKHYVSKRSRRQKGVLAFLVQDDETRVLCYGNAQVRKENQPDEILEFVNFWKALTGRLPQELVFDSRLTTYADLNRLNQEGVLFITLRRRSQKMLQEMASQPLSAWRRIELESLSRIYRTPRILDSNIELKDYEGPVRQIAIDDLGHEDCTFLLTNQLGRSAARLIERYARRMIIENSIEDSIDFFHLDALSSSVPMKVNCDLQLTLMASSLYRLIGRRIGNGYQTAKSRTIFRDFIDATATIIIAEKDITVRFQKRAHNPLLLHAGFDKQSVAVPWLGGRNLTFVFG